MNGICDFHSFKAKVWILGLLVFFSEVAVAQYGDNNPPVLSHQPKRWGEWGKDNTIEAFIGDNSRIQTAEITIQYQDSKATGTFPVDPSWDKVPVIVKPLTESQLYSKPDEQSNIRGYVEADAPLRVIRIAGAFYLVMTPEMKAGYIPANQTMTSISGKAYLIHLPAGFCKKSDIQYQIHAIDSYGNRMDSDMYTLSFRTEDEIVAMMQGKSAPRKKRQSETTYRRASDSFGGLALMIKAGTLGGGAGLAKSLGSKVNVRLAYNYLKFKQDGTSPTSEPMAYHVDLNLASVSGILDYYPFGKNFHLSGGVLYNKNEIKGTGWALETYNVEGNVYTPDDIGDLNILLKANSTWTPYVGLGFGNPMVLGRTVGFFIDFGAIYQGAPSVNFTAEEGSMIYPTTSQDEVVEENIKNLKWYPVFQLGLSVQL